MAYREIQLEGGKSYQLPGAVLEDIKPAATPPLNQAGPLPVAGNRWFLKFLQVLFKSDQGRQLAAPPRSRIVIPTGNTAFRPPAGKASRRFPAGRNPPETPSNPVMPDL